MSMVPKFIRSTSTQGRSLAFYKREDERRVTRSGNSGLTQRQEFSENSEVPHAWLYTHSYFEPFVEREKPAEKELPLFRLHFLLYNRLRWLGVSSTFSDPFFGPNKRAVGGAESVFCPWQLRTG